jgi:hypothetical protein
MPLKLFPPRPPKNASWTIRGTYLGCHINRSSGTREKALAEKIRKKLERDIESGVLTPKEGSGLRPLPLPT